MEMRQLKYFLAVAEELHFGRAAERLHLAQPALSVQIKNLEAELGGKLFERDKHRVELTNAGRLFVPEARKVLEQAERAADVAKLALDGRLGRLDFGYSDLAAFSGLLALLIKQLLAAYPGVKIVPHHLGAAAQLSKLLDGDIQASLTSIAGYSIPEGVAHIELASWPMQAVLPTNHPLAGRESVSAADLKDEPLIVYLNDPDDTHQTNMTHMLLKGRPNIAVKTGNAIMVVALVAAGQGVAFLPSLLRPMLPDIGAVFRPFSDRMVELDCSLVYRKDIETPVVRALLEVVRPLLAGTVGKRNHIQEFTQIPGKIFPYIPQ